MAQSLSLAALEILVRLKQKATPAMLVPTFITPSEWNVLINPLHPQFSLKWIMTGPDAYTFDARLLPAKRKTRSRRTADLAGSFDFPSAERS
jgi:hypothetical protein